MIQSAPAVLMVLALVLAGCTEAGLDGTTGNPIAGGSSNVVSHAKSNATSALSPAVISGLVFMREEEKLAHDVYDYLSDLYPNSIFGTIEMAESNHMSALKNRLDANGIPDPVTSYARGVFTNSIFAAHYAALTQQGTQSLLDALTVGAIIEDMDIKDLMDRNTGVIPQDISFVYGNLTNASENHIRAFVSRITALGGSYAPRYISVSLYNSILGSTSGRGPGGGGPQQGGGGPQGGGMH